MSVFHEVIEDLVNESHQNAIDKGWWAQAPERTFGDQIALMHTELSEAMEAFRINGLDSDMFIDFDYSKTINGIAKPEGIAVEFADVLIRIFDTCGRYNIPLGEALGLKMHYNTLRSYRHGGKKA